MSSEAVEEEITVLESIYDSQFERVSSAAWGMTSFRVKLEHVSLQFMLPSTYPERTPPMVEMSLSKGPLQERDVKALSKECKQFIENLFKESNQEVLCHEIISFCEDFIAKRLTAQNENLFTKMQDREKFALQTLKTARSQVGEDDSFDDNNGKKELPPNAKEWANVTPDAQMRENKVIGNDKGKVAPPSTTSNWYADFMEKYDIDDENDIQVQDDDWETDANHQDNNTNSRYLQEFQELQLLGRGGSGSVWKARNRLDGRLYAIKKIALNETLFRNIRREVTTISQLVHPSIVRYYGAWVETRDEDASESQSTEYTDTNQLGLSLEDFENKQWDDFSSSNNIIGFSHDEEDIFEPRTDDGVLDASDSSFDLRGESTSGKGDEPTNKVDTRGMLFIQMEYCTGSLRDLIDSGALVGKMTDTIDLFRQMLEAIAYCHDQRVLHRDLKPGNIFIHDSEGIRIGDFGLAHIVRTDLGGATVIEKENTNKSGQKSGTIVSSLDSSLTGAVGTRLYCASEQLIGGSSAYDSKVDMFSIGITFFEMMHPPFITQSERIDVINRLRENLEFPSDFADNEMIKQVIQSLISKNATQRPSATDLLQRTDLFPPQQIDINTLTSFMQQDSKYSKDLLSRLFSQKRAKDTGNFDMDAHAMNVQFIQPRMLKDNSASKAYQVCTASQVMQSIDKSLRHVFQLFGAVQWNASLLSLSVNDRTAGVSVNEKSNIEYLDRSGRIVALNNNLLDNWIREIERLGITNSRRYQIASVAIPAKSRLGYHPHQRMEAIFDVINDTKSPYDADVEVLTCALHLTRFIVDQTSAGIIVSVTDDRVLKALTDAALFGVTFDSDMHYSEQRWKYMTWFREMVTTGHTQGDGESELLPTVLKKMRPFLKYGAQSISVAEDNSWLDTLMAFEDDFLKSEAIAAIHREINQKETEGGDSTAVVPQDRPEKSKKPKASLNDLLAGIGKKKVVQSHPLSTAMSTKDAESNKALVGKEREKRLLETNKKIMKLGLILKAFHDAVAGLRYTLSSATEYLCLVHANQMDISVNLLLFAQNANFMERQRSSKYANNLNMRFTIHSAEAEGTDVSSRGSLLAKSNHFESLINNNSSKTLRCVAMRVFVENIASLYIYKPKKSETGSKEIGRELTPIVSRGFLDALVWSAEDSDNHETINHVLGVLRTANVRASNTIHQLVGVRSKRKMDSTLKNSLQLCELYQIPFLVVVDPKDRDRVVLYDTSGRSREIEIADIVIQIKTGGIAAPPHLSYRDRSNSAIQQTTITNAGVQAALCIFTARDKKASQQREKKAIVAEKVTNFLEELLHMNVETEIVDDIQSQPAVVAAQISAKSIMLIKESLINGNFQDGCLDELVEADNNSDRKSFRAVVAYLKTLMTRMKSVFLYSIQENIYDVIHLNKL